MRSRDEQARLAALMRGVEAAARQLREEQGAAAVLCAKILDGPPAWWAQRLRTAREARTIGMVQLLLERMRTRLECAPDEAELLTAMAVELSGTLDEARYPSLHVTLVRAQALRDHAYVLSFRGHYPEALERAARAEELFARIPAAACEAARFELVKAMIFRCLGRTDEAVALTQRAAATFLRFGDRARYVDARLTEGTVHYVAGAVERALEIWNALENDPALDDVGSVRLAHNIGLCLADLGQPAAAVPYLYRSAMQFELLGMETERTRSRAILGRSLVAAGKPREAVPILRQAVREFAAFGMVFDAGLIGLEQAEALLAADQPDEVTAVCREAIDHFTRAGVPSRAMTALAYLREASACTAATPQLVRDTRASLTRLQSPARSL